MNTVWVLTREINEYDQHGSYFEAVWAKKPSVQQLVSYFSDGNKTSYHSDVIKALEFFLHLHSGGGRMGTEYEWYNLEEVNFS